MENASRRAGLAVQVLILMAMVSVIAMLASGVRGGPLDPPDSPAPTDSVRLPGTPISSLPFTITQPGHYYLTRSLTSSGAAHGIAIDSDHVTLDLMGFTLFGPGAITDSAAITTSLTTPPPTRKSIIIRNGHIRNWRLGIEGSNAVYSEIADVIVTNVWYGVRIGIASRVHDCSIAETLQVGLTIRGSVVVERCSVVDGVGSGVWLIGSDNRITDSYIKFNHIGGFTGDYDLKIDGPLGLISDNKFGTAGSGSTTSTMYLRNVYCNIENSITDAVPGPGLPNGNFDHC
jgi:hypothetical protein